MTSIIVIFYYYSFIYFFLSKAFHLYHIRTLGLVSRQNSNFLVYQGPPTPPGENIDIMGRKNRLCLASAVGCLPALRRASFRFPILSPPAGSELRAGHTSPPSALLWPWGSPVPPTLNSNSLSRLRKTPWLASTPAMQHFFPPTHLSMILFKKINK